MRDKTRKRPPQGTVEVFAVDSPAGEAREARQGRALAIIAELSAQVQRADPDIAALADALDDRDDKEAGRLVKILRVRYKESWDVVSRILLRDRGRWIRRRKR